MLDQVCLSRTSYYTSLSMPLIAALIPPAVPQDDLLKQKSGTAGWLNKAWSSITGAPTGPLSGSNMPLVPGPYTSSWEGAGRGGRASMGDYGGR